MSKRKKQRTARPDVAATTKARPVKVAAPKAAPSRVAERRTVNSQPLVFGADTYKWMGIGAGLIFLGFLLMVGGRGDDPTVFDEDVIYSFRKITLAPIVILGGLGVVTYAIFKK